MYPGSDQPAFACGFDCSICHSPDLGLWLINFRNYHYVHQLQQLLCRDRSSELVWRVLQYLVLSEY